MNKILLAACSLVIFWAHPYFSAAQDTETPQSETSDEMKSYSTPAETPDMTQVNPAPQEPEAVAPESPPVAQQPETEPPAQSPMIDQQVPEQASPLPGT